jgi:hypothetical protein
MRDEKRKRLEQKGWRVGTVRDFLGLSAAETEYVEIRLRLSDGLRARRTRRGVTQAALAKAVRSSQSRVAKMEAADPLVSIDLLVRTLLTLGVSRREIAGLIGGPSSSHKAA